MKHRVRVMTAISVASVLLVGLGNVANAASSEAKSAMIQRAVVKRVDHFFAAQHNAPYGTYQFTDNQLYSAIRKAPGKYVLIDIRTQSTWNGIPGYREGHVAGAINIPYPQIPVAIKDHRIPTGKTVVVMCPTGQLSNQTAGVLRILGYDAYALRGGVNGWKAARKPLVVGPQPG